MPAVPHVQTLSHALGVLRYLNTHGTAAPRELQRHLNLTPGAVYRLLVTLKAAGYIDAETRGVYRATQRLLALGHGYDDETWPEDVAQPVLHELSRAIRWPAAIGTIEGPYVHVRATSDASSRFVLKALKPGRRVPLFRSAIGWVTLAAYPPRVRSGVRRAVELAATAAGTEMPAPSVRDRVLGGIARKGYHCVDDPRTRQIVLAVPVVSGARVLGGLSIRVYVASSSQTEVVQAYLAPVQAAARRIATAYARWSAA